MSKTIFVLLLGNEQGEPADLFPGFGRDLVDDGTLNATITCPPNTGLAISALKSFWTDDRPLPLRSFTEVTPYPLTSVGAS